MKVNQDDVWQLQETVARVTHIPDIPFGFKVLKVVRDVMPSQSVGDNMQIVYQPRKTTTVVLAQLKQWYEAEMEMLGWDCMSQFQTNQDLLLVFKRPGNVMCNITIDQQNTISITLLHVKKQT